MTNTEKKPVAVIYVRVSTEEQKKGLSIEVQEKLCRDRAEEMKYDVLKVFDDSGISGHREDRAGIIQIKELIVSNQINAVIALSSDRLYRNSIAHGLMMETMKKHNVSAIYINQVSRDHTATSILTDKVLADINEFYRDQVSEKVKATLYAKAKAGYFPTQPPVGYLNAPNPKLDVDKLARKIIKPDEVMAPIIMELFDRYSSGLYSVYDITDVMNDKGLRSHKGFKMSPSRIYDLLKNRVYLGEVHWGPVHNKSGKHKPLVDESTFNRVQMVLDANNQKACRRRKHQWLLAGFVMCPRHERRYVAEWHLAKGRAYYHCSNRTGCGKYCEQTDLEGRIADTFKDLQFSEDFIDLVIEKTKVLYLERRKQYEGRKKALVNKRTAFETRLKVAEDKLLNGTIPDEDFARIRVEVKASLEHVADQIEDLESGREANIDIAQEVLLFSRNIHKAFNKASFNLKRQYLGFFWDRFEVQDGVILKSVPSPLFRELMTAQTIFFKGQITEKDPQISGSSSGILTNSLLRG